jgi:ATP-dependent DNA helicase RecG
MRSRTIAEDEILALSKMEESHFFDRKAVGVSGKKSQKIAVAFANADGGEFIVGISDDKDERDPSKRWHGTTKLEDLNGLLQALFQVTPTLELKHEVLNSPSRPGQVLRVIVEKSAEVHKTSDGTVYQRYGAQSLPVDDPQRITELAFAKGAISFEDQLLKNVPVEQVVDSKELASFLFDYSPKTDPLEFCINQNLLDFKTWEPRVASILLFHPSSSAVNPRKCALKITRYETKEDDPERDHLAKQVTIEGSAHT